MVRTGTTQGDKVKVVSVKNTFGPFPGGAKYLNKVYTVYSEHPNRDCDYLGSDNYSVEETMIEFHKDDLRWINDRRRDI